MHSLYLHYNSWSHRWTKQLHKWNKRRTKFLYIKTIGGNCVYFGLGYSLANEISNSLYTEHHYHHLVPCWLAGAIRFLYNMWSSTPCIKSSTETCSCQAKWLYTVHNLENWINIVIKRRHTKKLIIINMCHAELHRRSFHTTNVCPLYFCKAQPLSSIPVCQIIQFFSPPLHMAAAPRTHGLNPSLPVQQDDDDAYPVCQIVQSPSPLCRCMNVMWNVCVFWWVWVILWVSVNVY